MSELKVYLCVQAREIENKTFSCYKQTLAVKTAPEAAMAEVYIKSDVNAYIKELEEKHKMEVDRLANYCREQTEKLCIEMTVVDSLEQNLKKLNRTIWLCRAWAARNLAVYYKLWSERYKEHSKESLAELYNGNSIKWKKFYHKFKALADKFKEEA